MCAASEQGVGKLHLEHREPVVNSRSFSKRTPVDTQLLGVYILFLSDEKLKNKKGLY
jgi:hypothetical protein